MEIDFAIIFPMEGASRHHCLIYEGAPSRRLVSLAAAAREKLRRNYRCPYLNTRPMVAGMASYLAAAQVDIKRETDRRSLLLASEQQHLVNGRFEVERMMQSLKDALIQALRDGFTGLWASGDMTWEMGPDQDFSKLLEYEQRLEEFFEQHPEMSGVCQYHADTLPTEVVRHGLISHRSLYITETLALLNPHYVPLDSLDDSAQNSRLDVAGLRLCHSDGSE